MDIHDQQKVLNSLHILVDTREQDTLKARARYKLFASPYDRATLSYGDYTFNLTLPDRRQLYDINETVEPSVIVERKMSLDELAECFTRGRSRFEREFERAKERGAKVYLLVENATWENLVNGKYRSQFHPNAFLASITAWMARYDVVVVFCKEETSGRLIKELLYREAKERIERGEYDC